MYFKSSGRDKAIDTVIQKHCIIVSPIIGHASKLNTTLCVYFQRPYVYLFIYYF